MSCNPSFLKTEPGPESSCSKTSASAKRPSSKSEKAVKHEEDGEASEFAFDRRIHEAHGFRWYPWMVRRGQVKTEKKPANIKGKELFVFLSLQSWFLLVL